MPIHLSPYPPSLDSRFFIKHKTNEQKTHDMTAAGRPITKQPACVCVHACAAATGIIILENEKKSRKNSYNDPFRKLSRVKKRKKKTPHSATLRRISNLIFSKMERGRCKNAKGAMSTECSRLHLSKATIFAVCTPPPLPLFWTKNRPEYFLRMGARYLCVLSGKHRN